MIKSAVKGTKTDDTVVLGEKKEKIILARKIVIVVVAICSEWACQVF